MGGQDRNVNSNTSVPCVGELTAQKKCFKGNKLLDSTQNGGDGNASGKDTWVSAYIP